MSTAVEVNNLNFAYDGQQVLRELNFTVEQGEFLAVAGPNGAGKTTLLNLLCGQLQADSGRIMIDGKSIESYSSRALARKAAVVRQEFIPAFEFTVTEIVAMARTPYLSRFGFESEEDKEIISEAMEITETGRFAGRSMDELSGGERQRVFIARALAQQSPILLLDEPTSFLDFRHQVAIYDLLKETQVKTGKTIIAISHDINLAIQYCDRALLIGGGKYHLGDIKEVFFRERIEETFGVKVLAGYIGGEKFFLPLGEKSKSGKSLNPG